MRESSRRGTPRQTRSAGRPAAGRDARGRSAAARGTGPGGGRPGYDGARSGPASRGGAQGSADTARLTSLIEPVLHAMDMDLEGVRVAAAGRRRVLKIVVDADGGVSLDDIAEVSREVSARLDAKNAMGEAPYTLEVSSPGVDRPLTEPRHWRRAIGRLVVVPLAGNGHQAQLTSSATPASIMARVIDADQDGVLLETDGERRTLSYQEIGPGRVQVEFGRLADEGEDDGELDGPGSLDGLDESASGPDEEGPDGH